MGGRKFVICNSVTKVWIMVRKFTVQVMFSWNSRPHICMKCKLVIFSIASQCFFLFNRAYCLFVCTWSPRNCYTISNYCKFILEVIQQKLRKLVTRSDKLAKVVKIDLDLPPIYWRRRWKNIAFNSNRWRLSRCCALDGRSWLLCDTLHRWSFGSIQLSFAAATFVTFLAIYGWQTPNGGGGPFIERAWLSNANS